MSKLNIHIKDSSKTEIILQLLREFPFVEIEQDTPKHTKKRIGKGNGGVEELFGIWKNRDTSLSSLREKAWGRSKP